MECILKKFLGKYNHRIQHKCKVFYLICEEYNMHVQRVSTRPLTGEEEGPQMRLIHIIINKQEVTSAGDVMKYTYYTQS